MPKNGDTCIAFGNSWHSGAPGPAGTTYQHRSCQGVFVTSNTTASGVTPSLAKQT